MAIATDIRLRPEVILHIRGNQGLKNKLQMELDISHSTLYRYLDINSDRLTTATALKVISEDMKKSKDELLTD